ncbi:MAG: heat shock protein GrpE [Candidatus Omnitrophica bacterium ADurb.Bin277]|nr:MAG: heat shock protein GrpE [Candidatus Omnitrophica bacterium ADurb.Bin277]
MSAHSKKNHHNKHSPVPEDAVKKESGPTEAKVELTAGEYETLKKRLEELEGLREKLLHAAADFENAKKRNARDKEEFIKFSQERILRDMLPVLDNFERAITHTTTAELSEADEEKLRQNFNNVASGVQMVQKQLVDTLKKHGLVRLEAVGEKFDPHRHEAVARVQESGEEDVVVDELRAGYMLHDRLLRASQVRVRTAPFQDKQDEVT